MIFAINLTVDTKTTDIYDKVAVNKFPVIVTCNDINDLRNKLSSTTTNEWIRSLIKTERLYNTAYFHIRGFGKNGLSDIVEIIWKVSDITKISY